MIHTRPLPKYRARTLPYTTERVAKARRAVRGQAVFERAPAELPTATVHVHAWSRAALTSRIRGAAAARWQWFRPRLVPVLVAAIGACALLAATNYLTNLAREVPSPPTHATGYQLSLVPSPPPTY
jgi:hypothetical protein